MKSRLDRIEAALAAQGGADEVIIVVTPNFFPDPRGLLPRFPKHECQAWYDGTGCAVCEAANAAEPQP